MPCFRSRGLLSVANHNVLVPRLGDVRGSAGDDSHSAASLLIVAVWGACLALKGRIVISHAQDEGQDASFKLHSQENVLVVDRQRGSRSGCVAHRCWRLRQKGVQSTARTNRVAQGASASSESFKAPDR
jgi:hypothetical protein